MTHFATLTSIGVEAARLIAAETHGEVAFTVSDDLLSVEVEAGDRAAIVEARADADGTYAIALGSFADDPEWGDGHGRDVVAGRIAETATEALR